MEILYNKGLKLLTEVEILLNNYESAKQSIKCSSTCSKVNCTNCKKIQNETERFYKELFITRSYYGVFLMMYSLVDTDPNKEKFHNYNYTNSRAYKFFITGKLGSSQENIRKNFLKELSDFQELRKQCDYRIDYEINQFEKHKKKLESLRKIIVQLGKPKC